MNVQDQLGGTLNWTGTTFLSATGQISVNRLATLNIKVGASKLGRNLVVYGKGSVVQTTTGDLLLGRNVSVSIQTADDGDKGTYDIQVNKRSLSTRALAGRASTTRASSASRWGPTFPPSG
jgi:hypothetical protein